jgi:hypothetical protein
MKNVLIIIATLVFASSVGFSQGFTDRETGPKAKNQKAWDKERKSEIVSPVEAKQTGPEAKNAKIWNKDAEKQKVNVQIERKELKGPKAKNAKPWDK